MPKPKCSWKSIGDCVWFYVLHSGIIVISVARLFQNLLPFFQVQLSILYLIDPHMILCNTISDTWIREVYYRTRFACVRGSKCGGEIKFLDKKAKAKQKGEKNASQSSHYETQLFNLANQLWWEPYCCVTLWIFPTPFSSLSAPSWSYSCSAPNRAAAPYDLHMVFNGRFECPQFLVLTLHLVNLLHHLIPLYHHPIPLSANSVQSISISSESFL